MNINLSITGIEQFVTQFGTQVCDSLRKNGILSSCDPAYAALFSLGATVLVSTVATRLLCNRSQTSSERSSSDLNGARTPPAGDTPHKTTAVALRERTSSAAIEPPVIKPERIHLKGIQSLQALIDHFSGMSAQDLCIKYQISKEEYESIISEHKDDKRQHNEIVADLQAALRERLKEAGEGDDSLEIPDDDAFASAPLAGVLDDDDDGRGLAAALDGDPALGDEGDDVELS